MIGLSRNDRHRTAGGRNLEGLSINISKKDYSRNIDIIRSHIENGDVYQITYCLKMKFGYRGDALALYNDLLKAQAVPYSAYIESGDFKILSLSPERFIKKDRGHVITEPMKGTWWRGGNFASDIIEKRRFYHDKKNRAENVMIADLLRNDLGRIGSNIRAPHLFKVTGYRTLYQMTSVVTGNVPVDIRLIDIFRSLFPSGSVTGAPKIRAMEIIREIEKEERAIYTGAIGYITPARDMYFNIPIRTILLKRDERRETRDDIWKGEMGIGGGIIWDSTAEGEWNEGLLKAKFLTEVA